MGKRRTRFIDPSASQHFHVVHRSQRDIKHGDPDAPQYVLLPGRRGNAAARASVGNAAEWDDQSVASSGRGQWRDHVNELGLPNDGYDYGKHLKSMGGGQFIAASGQRGGAAFHLPEDPEDWGKEGEGAIKPIVDAITLSADCMDEDIEAALFGSDDEDGDFEELNDDFILQAGKEPEAGEEAGEGDDAFNFEEHMARLIERSEKTMGWAPARGWEDGELEKLTQLVPRRNAFGEEDEYDDEYDDDSDDEYFGGMGGKPRSKGHKGKATSTGIRIPGSQERHKVEADFEDLLAEYSDDEIGELEDPADETAATRGQRDIDDDDDYIEHVLDDFLRAKIDDDDESRPVPASRQQHRHENQADNSLEGLLGIKKTLGGLFKKRMGDKGITEEQSRQGQADDDVVDDDEGVDVVEEEAESPEQFEAYISKHEYLGDREETSQWDCETILSTCSNLDNHPSMIMEPSKSSKRKGKSATSQPMQVLPEDGPASAINMIELSQKSGLPLGVLSGRSKAEGAGASKGADGNAGARRDKNETPEEKAARKAMVKQARKEGRQRKKEMTEVFKTANKISAIQNMNPESATNRSIFQYS